MLCKMAIILLPVYPFWVKRPNALWNIYHCKDPGNYSRDHMNNNERAR